MNINSIDEYVIIFFQENSTFQSLILSISIIDLEKFVFCIMDREKAEARFKKMQTRVSFGNLHRFSLSTLMSHHLKSVQSQLIFFLNYKLSQINKYQKDR